MFKNLRSSPYKFENNKSIYQVLSVKETDVVCCILSENDLVKIINKSMKVATIDFNEDKTYQLRVFNGIKFLFLDEKESCKIFLDKRHLK